MDNNLFGEIQEYTFRSFSEKPKNAKEEDVENYAFKTFSAGQKLDLKEHDSKIRLERESANQSNFRISPIVKEHRGLNKQEETDKERRISDEVNKRLIKLQEEAFTKAYNEGLEAGKNEMIQQERIVVEERLSHLTTMIEGVISNYSNILKDQKLELYGLVRTLTKWIILRELKDDGEYIGRLLEKLISELQSKANILIQVNNETYAQMPTVLDVVQEKVGALLNVRIEIDHELKDPHGMVISSDNGIINGTIEKQFISLDKLFESVGLNERE